MSLKRKIISSVFVRWLHYIIVAIVSFIMLPFVVHKLGNSVYGIWILIGSITGYLGLMDFGIGTGLVKYIAQYKAEKNEDQLHKLVNNAFFLYSVMGGICLLISLGLMLAFPYFFKTAVLNVSVIRLLIIIVGLQISLIFPLNVFSGILRGYNRYDIESCINMGVIVLRTSLIVFFLQTGHSVVALALSVLFANLAGYLIKIIYSFRLFPSMRIRFSLFDKGVIKTLFHFSFYVFIINIGFRVIFYTDAIVIGKFLTVALITVYSIGGRLVEYMRELVGLMSNVTMPVASKLNSEGATDSNKRLLVEGTKYCFILSLLLGVLLIFLGKPLIYLWMGSEYNESYIILVLLVIPEIFALSQGVTGAILYGLGKHKMSAIVHVFHAVTNLVLSILLVRRYGIIGVALGTSLPYLIFYAFIPIYTCRQLDFSVITYLRKSFVRPIIGAIPFFAYCLYFSKTDISSMQALFLTGVGAVCVYGAGISITCFESLKNLVVFFKKPAAAEG